RPALSGALHHGHRPRRPRERPRDLRRGTGRAAAADGARVHRDGAQALGPGPALRDRRQVLEDLPDQRHLARLQLGYIPRPYQKPHPPIALSLITPNSSSGKTAGERGWIPVSGQFFHKRYLRGHWEKYVEGCEAVGRRPDPDVWRVSRSILVTETDAEA